MRSPRSILAVSLLLAGSAFVAIASAQSSTIKVSDPWARRAAAMSHGDMSKGSMDKGSMDKGGMGKMGGGGTGAVYATISNSGAEADALVAASSDAAQTVELHEVINEGGVMKMRPVPKIAVPAGGKIEMKPGGYHVMLLGLKRDLKPGEKVAVTLKFERGGNVPVEAAVR
ncbi:MAG TPA: copper chaperone PCu(A)C [Candidatus Bathyarchaeia archaeon]|nr:copper chaperone PCu(A)C [Candidatus Bathyarchaeia archaeon]